MIASAMGDLLASLERRDVEVRARFALMGELREDEPSWCLLAESGGVAAGSLEAAERASQALEIVDASRCARELLALLDGLLFERVVARRDVQVTPIVVTYLRGVLALQRPAGHSPEGQPGPWQSRPGGGGVP